MDLTKESVLLSKLHENDQSIDSSKKKEKLKKIKESNENKRSSIESCIRQFNIKIREEPFLYAMYAIDCYIRNQ